MARQSIDGERIHVMLTKPQLRFLDKLRKNTGLTRSDLVRRSVDSFIAKEVKKR